MRKFLHSLVLALALVTAMPIAPVQAYHNPPGGKCVHYDEADRSNTDLAPLVDGVLIKYGVKEGGFTCYAYFLLYENMLYVIFIAMVLTVYSGVQYMLAGGSADQQGKAKERIWGIVNGIIFYFLIASLLRLLASGLSL